jgi:pyruvate/2-oxoglutarate dehydrogenase complex dihydrolipoamide acyltransferase (E2) component
MTDTVIMPQLGETVAEGKILNWFKSVGDEVNEGDNLFEVETDKVTLEVQSIVAGRLKEIRVGAGAVAKVGEVVAIVGGAAASAAPKAVEPPAVHRTGSERSPIEEVSTPIENFGGAKGPGGIRATPLARRLIAQNGLDIDEIAADARQRGEHRIDEKAVRAAIASRVATLAAPAAAPSTLPVERGAPMEDGDVIALNATRLRTADRLAENWRTIPHVFQAIEVDFTALDRVRRERKDAFKKAQGLSLTYLPFIARATCLAIQAFPQINARFAGNSLILSRAVNLGIAVDLSHNGLVVPVVRNAADLTLVGLAKAMNRQIEKARTGKLTLEDLSGGTYSISNNGAFGTTFTAPIINAPQVAILSTDAIKLKPAIVSTPQGDFVAARMIGMVGQSFDHRAFDGAYSAAFLSRLKRILEERDWSDELAEICDKAVASGSFNQQSKRDR